MFHFKFFVFLFCLVKFKKYFPESMSAEGKQRHPLDLNKSCIERAPLRQRAVDESLSYAV
jgi:hypothetical protein